MANSKECVGLLGKKVGMTEFFAKTGQSIPVTALKVGPCFVVQVKTLSTDGYGAVQLGFEKKKLQRVNKPMKGHFSKAGAGSFYFLKEVRCNAEELGWSEVGKELKVADVFAMGDKVSVRGVSKGRGFAGVVKRYGMAGQPATRGTHEYRRNVGSVGCRKFPGRIWKNKRMPGHMGNKNVTIKNLKVVDIDKERNLIFVKGSVPGPSGGVVFIYKKDITLPTASDSSGDNNGKKEAA